MSQDPIVIVAANRTPMGGMLGSLSALTASELGSHAIQAAIEIVQTLPGFYQNFNCILCKYTITIY